MKYYKSNNSASLQLLPADRAARPTGAVTFLASFKLLLLLALGSTATANATTWYVDSTATSGSKNGISWANAWTSISSISGVKGGDVVYISGGPSGSSQTYSLGGTWTPTGGSSGSPITYQIGQDSAHNGTAIFSGSGTFVNPVANAAIVGDAGDGQMHFATSGYAVVAWYQSSTVSNFRLGFINFGQMSGSGGSSGDVMYLATVNGFRFDHNYVVVSSPQANAFAYMVCAGSGYDQNWINNNTIYLPHGNLSPNGPSIGADGFESGGSVGYALYSNSIIGYNMSYTGSQHQDGWQDTGGSSYIKIFDNTFMNLGNSDLFADATFGGFANVQVYNNICIISDINFTDQQYPSGIDFWTDGGFTGGTATFNNILIANNLAIGFGTTPSGPYGAAGNHAFIDLANASTHATTFSGDLVANNVAVALGNQTDAGYVDTTGNSGTPVLDTVTITSKQTADFVNFVNALDSSSALTMPTTANSLLGDNFQLSSAATVLIGQGANESSYFTTDKNGNARQASGNWDIGPFVYGSVGGGNPSPTLTVSPVTANASDVDPNTAGLQVYEGTTVQYSAAATATGTNTVGWQWSYTVNGGSPVFVQSGTGTIPSVSFNYGTGTGGNTYVWTVTASNGVTSVSSSLTMSVETPPAPNTSLTFQATSGVITAPFAVTGNYVSQPNTTTTIAGDGEATYTFSITNAGNYVIQALVNAPSDSANSFYVNIDAQPVDPTMSWDIFPMTTNFQYRIVSWRGTGTDTNNQYIPKIFTLATGTHQIIFAGREANTQLESFSILELPATPQNLRILPNVSGTAPSFSAGP